MLFRNIIITNSYVLFFAGVLCATIFEINDTGKWLKRPLLYQLSYGCMVKRIVRLNL